MRECVAGKGYAGNGRVMYWGTRVGGPPWLATPWRWGYGWKWPTGYEGHGDGGTGN